jgi:hypothetical protein
MRIAPTDPTTSFVQQTAVDGGWRPRHPDESSRAWPRYEPGFTHFELGESSDYRPTAVMAKRYTPRQGVRKD